MLVFVFALISMFYFVYPVLRHYWDTKREREMLEKKYNRMWRSRNDLLVSCWACSALMGPQPCV